MKKTTRKNKAKFASKILKSQKDDYQKIFRAEIRKGGDPQKAAVRAGSIYRSRYGATRTKRWKLALKRAK